MVIFQFRVQNLCSASRFASLISWYPTITFRISGRGSYPLQCTHGIPAVISFTSCLWVFTCLHVFYSWLWHTAAILISTGLGSLCHHQTFKTYPRLRARMSLVRHLQATPHQFNFRYNYNRSTLQRKMEVSEEQDQPHRVYDADCKIRLQGQCSVIIQR